MHGLSGVKEMEDNKQTNHSLPTKQHQSFLHCDTMFSSLHKSPRCNLVHLQSLTLGVCIAAWTDSYWTKERSLPQPVPYEIWKGKQGHYLVFFQAHFILKPLNGKTQMN